MKNIYLLCLWLFVLSACTLQRSNAPTLQRSPSLQILTVAELRAARVTLLEQRVTVQGLVTSTEEAWSTLQSGGAGMLLPRSEEMIIAQEILVTGRVAEVEGQLALLELEEVLIEQAQGVMPEPVPLTLSPEQESLYVRVGPATLDAQGMLRLADGRTLALRAPDSEVARRLTPNVRLDAIQGVLRRAPQGWLLVPPLARDVTVAPPFLTLCEIQGTGEHSPHKGALVETVGIVTADWRAHEAAGFFLQAPGCDEEPRSSDALFVAAEGTTGDDLTGAQVRLRGRVEEFYRRTQITLDAGTLLVEAQGLPLPAAVALADDISYESLEGMLVRLEEGVAVGPTTRYGEFALLPSALAPGSSHLMRVGGTLDSLLLIGIGGQIAPAEVAVGARVSGVQGPLDFTFGAFKIQPTLKPIVEPAPPPLSFDTPPVAPDEWSVATLNTENLFDSEDDTGRADEESTLSPEALAIKIEKLASTIAGPLGFPTVLALQEVENIGVLRQLTAHPRLVGRYEPLLLEGNDGRGIDQALLVERGRITLLESALANGCSPLAAPGGSDSSSCPAGERLLFERPPLVAHLRLDDRFSFYLINNHFKSKRGGEQETQPRRVAQAHYVAALVTQLRQSGAEVIVLGDLNDGEESQTVATLTEGAGLANLWLTLPADARYSYIFMGASQVLDHILVTPALAEQVRTFSPLHVNADYPHSLHDDPTTLLRSSDHDPLRVVFRLP
ncbi:MAG: hypothetical protein H0T73_06720 [Ardenticatenales bacterium]|nr:hypothetical protein [Ardenticatenales bacterium]